MKGRNGSTISEFNQEEYVAKMAAAGVVYPNLKSQELQESYKAIGAEMLLRKMLRPGEYGVLLEKAQEMNGFVTDTKELIDEVKKLIEEGDASANYAYYALHELRILPHELMNMNEYERAAIYAMIDIRVEQERKARRKSK